ncbi:MAG: hypothetical protein IKB08_07270 [Clostridia bacterium]|nr:hypothetical protein [Clostridia bacterium]
MKKILITDKTLTVLKTPLSFREKTETAKQLDKLGVDIIELPAIKNEKTDTLLIKNIVSVIEKSAVSVPVGLTKESVQCAASCMKDAKKGILSVAVPVSPAGMEYISSLKPAKMLERIEELVTMCKTLCEKVEFSALDASRAEKEFLYKAINTAIKAGADIISLSDDAGCADAEEFSAFIKDIYENCDGIDKKDVIVDISDEINMSTACAAAAVKNGATGIKTTVFDSGYLKIENISAFLFVKGEKLGVTTGIKTATLKNVCEKLSAIVSKDTEKESPYDGVVRSDEEIELHKNDDFSTVAAAVQKIGYELSHEDSAKVYEEFVKLCENKEYIGTKELEAIIASAAMQVPSTYKLKSYVINAGNIITATANLCIEKDKKTLTGVYVGDGPIDAAFLAIEQVVGHHFELDDFQIQSVTEGREAMGQALVKLRSDSGKLYSGSGLSTDVIGASIKAYLNALNKIAFEENR